MDYCDLCEMETPEGGTKLPGVKLMGLIWGDSEKRWFNNEAKNRCFSGQVFLMKKVKKSGRKRCARILTL